MDMAPHANEEHLRGPRALPPLDEGHPGAHLRKVYRRRLWRFVKARRDSGLFVYYLFKIAMHYHQYTMAKQMASGQTAVFNSF